MLFGGDSAMSSLVVRTLMSAAEKGALPDAVCRAGIRRLLRSRLHSLNTGDVELEGQRFRKFIADCRNSAIAVVPELANDQHYEVPAQLFEKVLGENLKYSCCEWTDETQTLDQAEARALATTCERAELQDGMSILELGCGWGSLSLWMARKYPNSRILAVSNSASQRSYIERRAEAAGVRNLTVITADMNDFSASGMFDRVVSIEMFEHMRNHEELLRRISGWLNPDGKLFVHIFCHRTHSYLFESVDDRDWMARHFFSGGMMPSESLLAHYQTHLTLTDQWRWSGKHYERTCNEWLKRQDANEKDLMNLLSETYGEGNAVMWFNRWRMFFMACAELFGFRDGNEWWVAHYLFQKRTP